MRNDIAFYFILLSTTAGLSSGFCPEECDCHEDSLFADCRYLTSSSSVPLKVIPIMLNPSIRRLDAQNNKIRKLEGALHVYTHLESLDLSHNEFSTLGQRQFFRQNKLQRLNVSNNFLTALHKFTFEGLHSLQILDLNDNAISSLDDRPFNATNSLFELRLKRNRLVNILPSAFEGLRRLRVLHLENNLLETLDPSWFEPLENLRFLYLADNVLTTLDGDVFRQLPAMRVVDLGGNRLCNVSDRAFRGLRSVDTVDFSYNLLDRVPNVALREMPRLRQLDVSGNPIRQINFSSFQTLFVLEILSVSDMPDLETVDSLAFMDNIKLEKLYLENNPNLHPLPWGVFVSNTRLRLFSVRNNSWSTISPNQVPASLRTLRVSGLPLQCNCSVTWLWDLYQRMNESSGNIDLDEVHCVDDPDSEGRVSPTLSSVSVDGLACSTHFTRVLVVVSASVIVLVIVVSILLCIAYKIRQCIRERKNDGGLENQCMYVKDDTMIYKYSGPTDTEPFYEVPRYDVVDKSSESLQSSKYSSSGYIGSELWEPEYYASTSAAVAATTAASANTGLHSRPFGSPHNSSSGCSTGSNNNNNNTMGTSFQSPSRGHLLHHYKHQSANTLSSTSKNNKRLNLYV